MHQEENEDFDNFPITYSIDNQILMHREAHFGGDFALMLDYYTNEGKGVNKEFELSRIEELAKLEQQTGKDLVTFMLSGPEIEKIGKAKKAYKDLREVYSVKNPKNKIPKLIVDLIFAENADTDISVEAAIAEKSAIVPALVDLLRNEDYYDPLFPGYGQARALAARCLGKIEDKRAIISLYESIGEGDFFDDDLILSALHSIGEPAKSFLLKVVHGQPINHDNEQAAIALINFKEDPEVSLACLSILKEIDITKHEALATYLVLACEGLPKASQTQLIELADKLNTPKTIKQDIKVLANFWHV
ncbi:MAG: HEAT repeat domain-containing protein [Parachlamydiaceae bacterium]|nr:HEAT repeat domain-containing protein [Parachlamydiaceae bacterium]